MWLILLHCPLMGSIPQPKMDRSHHNNRDYRLYNHSAPHSDRLLSSLRGWLNVGSHLARFCGSLVTRFHDVAHHALYASAACGPFLCSHSRRCQGHLASQRASCYWHVRRSKCSVPGKGGSPLGVLRRELSILKQLMCRSLLLPFTRISAERLKSCRFFRRLLRPLFREWSP